MIAVLAGGIAVVAVAFMIRRIVLGMEDATPRHPSDILARAFGRRASRAELTEEPNPDHSGEEERQSNQARRGWSPQRGNHVRSERRRAFRRRVFGGTRNDR